MTSLSYEASTARAVKSLLPMTPSERGRCNLSEISQSSKLVPGSAEAHHPLWMWGASLERW